MEFKSLIRRRDLTGKIVRLDKYSKGLNAGSPLGEAVLIF